MNNIQFNQHLIASEIEWLAALRQNGIQNFVFPSTKAEYWKYTRLIDFKNKEYSYATPVASDFNFDFNGYKICFENGFFNPAASELPDGVEVLPLIEAIILERCQDYLGKLALMHKAPFVALNDANLQEGVFIKISKNIKLKKPIAIINHTQGNDIWYNLRNVMVVEEGASLSLFEYFCYDGEQKSNYFSNIVNEIFIQKNACLNHYKIQKDAFYANHIALSFVDVQQGGIYNNFTLQVGANIGRNELKINLAEQEAQANVNALYKMSGWALIDNTILISHRQKNTTSNQLVKGVVDGQAKGVFQGKISIERGCDNVSGNQQHRAILLSDMAEVDVKPELEIFNDDVKCSHGSAIGKLDENAMFYLRSRGISELEAKNILIEAFLAEILDRIDDSDIKSHFLLAI